MLLHAHFEDPVAQQGERHLDRVEVAGSNPVGVIRVETVLNQYLTRFFLL